MEPAKPKLSILVAIVLMVVMIADFVPHPTLRSSLVASMVQGIWDSAYRSKD